MAYHYGKLRTTASRLLARFGMPVTMRRSVKQPYEPSAPDLEEPSVIEWNTVAVKTGISEQMLNDTRIQAGDMQLLVDCEKQEFIPQIGDTVTFSDGDSWLIAADMPVEPAGTTVFYKGVIHKG